MAQSKSEILAVLQLLRKYNLKVFFDNKLKLLET